MEHRVYEFTRMPGGFNRTAETVWAFLNDQQLYEVDGKLVWTEGLEEYLDELDGKPKEVYYCLETFKSFADFESKLLEIEKGWKADASDDKKIGALDNYLAFCDFRNRRIRKRQLRHELDEGE